MSDRTPPPSAAGGPAFEEDQRRPLSPWRVGIALLLVAGLVAGVVLGVRSRQANADAAHSNTWFGPYVDVTATPTYAFQSPSSNPAAQTVLGFVVSDPAEPCTPSWGGYATLSQADQSLALSSRIAELSQQGAQAVVSFGGRANTDLAVGCTSVDGLAYAYTSVIDHYGVRAVDFDVEGGALGNAAANERRAQAIAQVQQAARAQHEDLAVWLTLPVEPDGLQDNAVSVLDSMLAARVDVAGVNILAMDFSTPPAGGDLLGEIESAAQSVHGQLIDQLGRYGVDASSLQAWQDLGVTAMIGQNDQAGQRFTTSDAQGLVDYAHSVKLGRVSMWSLNRDSQCGSSFARVGVLSNNCSGVPQSNLQFSQTLAKLTGTVSDQSSTVVVPRPDTDPADAPFPLWSPTTPYQASTKIVRNGYIYEAKWYNAGQDPAAGVGATYETPWELLGPVLPGSTGPSTTTTTSTTLAGP